MQAGAIDRTKVLLEQVIAYLMQRAGRLPQSRLDDHDGAVRCEKRQELSDNRSAPYQRIDRWRKQFIEAVRHNNQIIRPAPHNLLTKITLERMFQIALDTSETCVGYSNLVAVGLPQSLRVLQGCVGRIGSQDRYSFR